MTYKFSKGHAMNDQNASVAAKNSKLSRITRGLLASVGLTAFVLVSAPALAATAPDLLTSGTYGVLSSTYTNTAAGTTINGDLGYTTAPAVNPIVTGATNSPPNAQAGIDQGTALATLNAQTDCISLGTGAVALNAIDLGAGPGVFAPGCYTSGGAMNITVSTTVTLVGTGVYIFRPAGALTTGANSKVVATGGACESDVFWTPTGATTIGANDAASLTPTFIGTIIDNAGISLGHFANLRGRALAFGGTVTTDANTIAVPTCAAFVPPVTPVGGVELGKVFSLASISAGGVSRLTITLSNNNAGVATLSSPLIDTLPTNVMIAPTPNAITTCGGAGTLVAEAAGTTVTLPAGRTIPGGTPGTCTVAVNVTSSVAGGPYTNTLGIGALVTDIASNTVAASADLTVTGAAVATTLGTVASSSVALGGAIYDTATLSGGNAPTGTITFNLYAPSDSACAGAPVFTSLVPVNGNGSYTSASFTSAAIGTYRWIANYSGDANNAATANTCNAANESVDVTAAPPPASIPTLSEWAMFLLVALLAMTGFVAMRRQV
ncbi:MAG: IPTL-CTERM sorting domain-containing protein [Thiobacillus sp.]